MTRNVRRSRKNFRNPIPATGLSGDVPGPPLKRLIRGRVARPPIARKGALPRRDLFHTGLSGPAFTQQPIPSRFVRQASQPPVPLLRGRAIRASGPNPGTPASPVAGGCPTKQLHSPVQPPINVLRGHVIRSHFKNTGLATPADVAGPLAPRRQASPIPFPVFMGRALRGDTGIAPPAQANHIRRRNVRAKAPPRQRLDKTRTTFIRDLLHFPFFGFDSLRIHLTGAASDGASQPSQTQSLGGWRAADEATRVGYIYDRPLRGISIIMASRRNGDRGASGSIVASTPDTLKYTAPGSGTPGDPITIANGETKTLVDGGDHDKWVRVTRTAAADLSSFGVVEFDDQFNNVFGMSNAPNAESIAGGDRYRAVILRNIVSDSIPSSKAYIKKLGTSTSSSGGGLPAVGAGTIVGVGDAFCDWPHQGWAKIESSVGADKEHAYYSSRTDNTLTVPALGRARLGSSATAGASGDLLHAVPGIRIAKEAVGVSGDIQMIASESTAPTGLTWNTGITAATGVDLGMIPGGGSGKVGLWFHRELPAGVTAFAQHYNQAVVEFYAEGKTFGETVSGMYRIAVDAMDRYEIFWGIGSEPAVIGGIPNETTATLPYTTTATFPASTDVRIVTQRRNKYNLVTESLATTRLLTGGTPPPSPPEVISWKANAGGTFTVKGVYFSEIDPAAQRADQFLIYITFDGSTPTPGVTVPVIVAMIDVDGAPTINGSSGYTTAAQVAGTIGKVLLRTRRSSDTSDSISTAVFTATAVTTGPAAPASSVHYRNVAEQDQ